MPRYEFTEGTSNKFWQIELNGAQFTCTWGKVGTLGTSAVKTWKDDAAAQKEHDKLVAEKTKKGYRLVEPAGEKPAAAPKPVAATKPAAKSKLKPATAGSGSSEDFARRIDENPDDAEAFAVYADWLQSQGDPRGELAVVQERLRAEPKNKEMLTAERKLLKQHAATLIGPWAKYAMDGKGFPGCTARPMLEPDFREGEGDPPLHLTWRSGFIVGAYVSHPGMDWSPGGGGEDDEGGEEVGEVEVPKLLTEVLSSASTRFLSSLRLGMAMNPEDGEQDYVDVIKALMAHEAAGRLTKLYLGDVTRQDSEVSWLDLGDLSKLWARTPRLRSLTVRGGSGVKLGKLDLPELRELIVITGGLDKKNLAAICAARWPHLEKLELWFGNPSYGGNTTVKDLRPILDGTAFPAVKHLGLRNCSFADELAAEVPGARILKQLESLDLSKGTMTEPGAQALATGKAALASLRRIDLSDNFLGPKSSKLAGTIHSQVRVKPQRGSDNDEYRYTALGE